MNLEPGEQREQEKIDPGVLRLRAGVDVPVDQHEAIVTVGTPPLGLQAEMQVGARGPVERFLLAAARTVMFEFLAHVEKSGVVVV